MRREPTEEQRQAAKLRRERFRAIVRDLAKLSEEERLALASRLTGIATCEGHGLSLHNTLLLARQDPTATIVGGFRQWKRQGRSVRKGEHGAMIWCPILAGGNGERAPADTPQPSEIDGKPTGVRFIVGTVFDIGQTEPSSLT